MRLEFAEEVKPLIDQQTILDVPSDWVSERDAQDSYLNRGFGNSYDFNQID